MKAETLEELCDRLGIRTVASCSRSCGPEVYYYTTSEAVTADFPQAPSPEYCSAVAALSSFPEYIGVHEYGHGAVSISVSSTPSGVAREGFGTPLVLGPSKR